MAGPFNGFTQLAQAVEDMKAAPASGFQQLEQAVQDMKDGIVRPAEGYKCGVWYSYPEHMPPKDREVLVRYPDLVYHCLDTWGDLYEALLWPMDSTSTIVGEGWENGSPDSGEWLMFPLQGEKDGI